MITSQKDEPIYSLSRWGTFFCHTWAVGLGVFSCLYFCAYWLGLSFDVFKIALPISLLLGLLRGFIAYKEKGPAYSGGHINRYNHDKLIETVAIGLAVLISVLATSTLHRPEGDDVYYIGTAIATLDHPDLTLNSFDTIHGEDGWPPLNVFFRYQNYELFAAALSSFTGLSVLDISYLILPLLTAVILPFSTLLTARAFGTPRGAAAISALLTVFFLLIWSDGYRSFGEWGFQKLSVGKAIYMTVGIPLTFYFGWRFWQRPSVVRVCDLALCGMAGICLTSSAMILTPVAIGFALLIFAPLQKSSLRPLFAGVLALLPCLLTFAVMMGELSSGAATGDEGTRRTLAEVTGGSFRTFALLAALVALPWLFKKAGFGDISPIFRLALLLIIFIASGVLSFFLAAFGPALFSWRAYWLIPGPLIMGMTVASLTWIVIRKEKAAIRAISGVSAGSILVLFAAAGPIATYSAPFKPLSYRVEQPAFDIAYSIKNTLTADDLVAAPTPYAMYFPMFSDQVRVSVVRPQYLHLIKDRLSPKEWAARKLLQDYLDDPERFAPSDDGEDLANAAERNGITTLLSSAPLPKKLARAYPVQERYRDIYIYRKLH